MALSKNQKVAVVAVAGLAAAGVLGYVLTRPKPALAAPPPPPEPKPQPKPQPAPDPYHPRPGTPNAGPSRAPHTRAQGEDCPAGTVATSYGVCCDEGYTNYSPSLNLCFPDYE